MNALQSFLKEMQGAFTSRAVPETLEGKITRLYTEGHYTDSELKQFLSIPKKHRVDPFEVIDDGDVYWADKRNVDKLERDLAQGREDLKNGRTTGIDVQNIWASIP